MDFKRPYCPTLVGRFSFIILLKYVTVFTLKYLSKFSENNSITYFSWIPCISNFLKIFAKNIFLFFMKHYFLIVKKLSINNGRKI